MAIIGRLKPGVGVGSAQAEVSTLAPQIMRAHPERNDLEGKVTLLEDHVSGRIRPALVVLACAVGVVMLIVCANLSNLLLARTATRQKEIAIRTALGAGQGRLIRQVLTESLVLSFCGSALGLILAVGGTRTLAHLDAINIPLLQNVRTDTTAVAFTLLMAVLTGLIFGMVPALQVPSAALHDALKEANRGSTGRKGRGSIRDALVVSEIAFACVLLVGAGLLIRSFLGCPARSTLASRTPKPPWRTPAIGIVAGRDRGTRSGQTDHNHSGTLRRVRPQPRQVCVDERTLRGNDRLTQTVQEPGNA
jgi:hypothetical protein